MPLITGLDNKQYHQSYPCNKCWAVINARRNPTPQPRDAYLAPPRLPSPWWPKKETRR